MNMSLYRQLFLGLSLLFLLLLAGTAFSQFTTTHDYLVEQQTIEIDNAIHAVGLAISPYVEQDDTVAIESVINAMFDGSLYQKVSLQLLENNTLIERAYPVQPSDAPHWFQHWVNISPVTRQDTLTSGWLQYGKITVTSSPALAYSKLWQSSWQLLTTFIIGFVVGVLTLKLLLDHLVKKPLSQFQQKAHAIADKHFGQPLPTPSTKEFVPLAHAFNQMSAKIEQHFNQQAQEADLLRKRAYQDPESGLNNRRRLLLHMEDWLEQETTGAIVIVKLEAISWLRGKKEYQRAAQLAEKVGHHLKSSASESERLGRLSHSEFIIIQTENAAPIDQDQSSSAMRNLLDQLNHIQAGCSPDGRHPVYGGVIIKHVQSSLNVSALLAQCDNVLSKAQHNPYRFAVIHHQNGQLHKGALLPDAEQQQQMHQPEHLLWGKQQWLDLCLSAIENDNITLSFQMVRDNLQHPVHQEVFAVLKHHEHCYSAHLFIPALNALKQTAKLDRHIIQKAVHYLSLHQTFLAINIAPTSIADTEFIQWLDSFLAEHPVVSQQLIFELPEIAFIDNNAQTRLLCMVLDKHCFTYGIDHFGHHFDSVGYLRQFQPLYVKIDTDFTRQPTDDIQQDALRALLQTAHHRSIKTIATRVEHQPQYQALKTLGIMGFQGHYITNQKEVNHG
ncbi:EAL domain-containing protein [Photobacterium sp. ZSDE20]|uniref:EAL domain-containing protein n=1 Tax=Photobacterium pectinilyticum TaxID=2906793 RepID=A0ABT1N1T1_9GAMM|nr:EAL domain-containing protein [Photobacterium sp. ZSDE20]MCQ1058693.1 EAL domain-containing protein [Photobacterium sp. ZSDE20]MDD1823407.1 EAL domain-containing protein [Photobacterium sp. ZSDE20]